MLTRGIQQLRFALTLTAALALVACAHGPTQQPAEEAIEDGVVTARVRAALIEDPLTSQHHIDVATFKGQVKLSGFVETDEARERALNLAREIAGAKNVQDLMQVRVPAGS
jgi:hyperosmotically inducible protein